MAGKMPPFLAAAQNKASGGNKQAAIARRLQNLKKAKKKTPPFSKSDPDYAQDMAGK